MIGIFDSGAGGLSVLREALRVLPRESYVYYSDNAFCPYGERTAAFVTDRARFVTGFLLGKGADIIVVACNTATSAAVATLRREFSDASDPAVRERVLGLTGGRRDHVMFIGMEPAVKPAAAMTGTGVVGVLATAGTLRGSKYLDARELYASRVRIAERPGVGFVEMVESGRVDDSVVEASLRPLLEAGADVVVLGCSHYPFLIEALQRAAARLAPGREVRFIDPAPAVAARLVDVMRSEGLLPPAAADGVSARGDGVGSGDGRGSGDGVGDCVGSGRGVGVSGGFPAPAPSVALYASGPDDALRRLYGSIVSSL